MQYTIAGQFGPHLWREDFHSDEGKVNVTMTTESHPAVHGTAVYHIGPEETDRHNQKWVTAHVRELTPEIAREILGRLAHCRADEIEIVELGKVFQVGH